MGIPYLAKCPHYRRWPHFRGVRKAQFHCMSRSAVAMVPSMSRSAVARTFCSCQDLSIGDIAETCCVTDKLHDTLHKYSYSNFRDGQLEALLPLLHGRVVLYT